MIQMIKEKEENYQRTREGKREGGGRLALFIYIHQNVSSSQE